MPSETPKPADAKPPLPWHKALWKEWIRPIGTVLAVMIVVRSSLFDWNDVPSGSMLPTIQVGDRVCVNKMAYGLHFPLSGPKIGIPFTRWDDRWDNPLYRLPAIEWGAGPKRGEIVTFWSPQGPKRVRLIKRVVAEPRDKIEVRNGHVWLNGNPTTWTTDVESMAVRWTSMGTPQSAEVTQQTEQADGTPAHPIWLDLHHDQWRDMPEFELQDGEYFCMGDNRDHSADSRVFMVVKRRDITGRAFGVAFSLEGWSPRWGRTFHGLD